MADEATTRFPFINLEKALPKAKQIFDGDRSGKAMPVATAFELWGYSPKSSGGFQTVGALKYYGLLEDEGASNDRKVKLTEQARHYFLDERDDTRAAMLADFALRPALFRSLWKRDKWCEGVPADTVARSHLKLQRHLNDQSARSALAIFKENIQFAGLTAGVVPADPFEQPADPEPFRKGPEDADDATVQPEIRANSDRFASSPPTPSRDSPVDARVSGDRVIISANVDLKGLRRLKKQINLLEQILMLEDDEDTGWAG